MANFNIFFYSILLFVSNVMLKKIAQLFGKYTAFLSHQDLNQKIDTTNLSFKHKTGASRWLA